MANNNGKGWHGEGKRHSDAIKGAYLKNSGTLRRGMVYKNNPQYKIDRKGKKMARADAVEEFNRRIKGLLAKYKIEITRQAGSKGFDVFENYSGRDESSIDELVNILKGGQEAYDNYMIELQDMNSDYVNGMTVESIKQFLIDEGMDTDEVEAFTYSTQWDEFRNVFEEHLNYNIKVFFNYDVLLREKESYEVGYDGANNFIDKSNKESLEFQKKAFKYISPLQLNTILNNSYGGVGYFGIIINAMDVLDAIREDKKTISGRQLVIGIHDSMNGSGYFVQETIPAGETFTIKLDGARLDHGSYSIGDVFGSVDWKWR